MKQKKWLKVLIPVVAVVLTAAIGVGIWHVAGSSNAEPVNVYPFEYLGMTEYWADSQESYGPVTTDSIQTIYLSDTQTVIQTLVEVGDTVQKGDLLMVFDTTLSDLALERERLAVEKLKIQLNEAYEHLREIRNMKPMVIPEPTIPEETEPNLGTMLTDPYRISVQKEFDGSSADKALICWIRSDVRIDSELLEAVRQAAVEYQTLNASQQPTEPAEELYCPPFDPTEPTETPENPTEPTGGSGDSGDNSGESSEPTEIPEESTEPSEIPEESTEPTEIPEESTEPTEIPEESTEPPDVPTEPTEPEVPEVEVTQFFVVFKSTEGDMSLGFTTVWQGMDVTLDPDTGLFTFALYNADGFDDHTVVPSEEPEPTEPEIDTGSGFTAVEIAEMRAQQEKLIRDLEFQVKMAEADYKIKQTEVESGEVRATIDGEVVSLLSEEEAKMTMQPVLKVSGGGGYYIEGSVSELERDNLVIGQEVTVNDWNNGMVYTGTIQSIGDAPSADGSWNGMGNPNASYYPFTVFVDGSADLQPGYYASVMFTSATAQNGIYLENPFLRTEQGKSYVYVRGEDGNLEKRYVTTGKSLWGSYTEILSGITAEDFIAFPYGKNLKEGAPTKESDLSELYDY